MKKANKIGIKFFLGMSLLILIPISIVAYTSLNITFKVFENTIRLTSLQTTQVVNNGFQNFLNGLTSQLDILCQDSKIVDFDNDEDPEEVSNFLKRVKKSMNSIYDIRYGIEDGDIFIDSSGYTKGKSNYKDEEWYKNSNSTVTISNPYFKGGLASAIVTLTKQVVKDGKVIGVLAMDIDSSTIKEYISSISILNTGYVIITDDDGNIIVNNSKNTDFKGEINSLPFFNTMKEETVGFYKYNNKENPLYIVQFPINNTSWKLVGILSQSERSDKFQIVQVAIVIVTIVCLIIAFIVAYFCVRYIVKVLNSFKLSMEKVSEGDLSFKLDITSNDEIGQLQQCFNKMLTKISYLINSINNTAFKLVDASANLNSMSEEVNASAFEVSSSIETVAQGAVNQAEASQDSVDKMIELSNKIDLINANITDINDFASKTNMLSIKGSEIVDELINNSKRTKSNSINSQNIACDMVKSIENIKYISDTILSITNETSILSLNASIEAARAGEYGKGFAVVAEEIRKLASESQASADAIKVIIAEITKKAHIMQESIKETTEIIVIEDESANKTKEIFNSIANSVRILTKSMEHILNLTKEMKGDESTVKENIDSISDISRDAAAVSEEVSASMHEVNVSMEDLAHYAVKLNEISEKLKLEMNRFKL